jgi:hypothetical protein
MPACGSSRFWLFYFASLLVMLHTDLCTKYFLQQLKQYSIPLHPELSDVEESNLSLYIYFAEHLLTF